MGRGVAAAARAGPFRGPTGTNLEQARTLITNESLPWPRGLSSILWAGGHAMLDLVAIRARTNGDAARPASLLTLVAAALFAIGSPLIHSAAGLVIERAFRPEVDQGATPRLDRPGDVAAGVDRAGHPASAEEV